MQRNDGRIFDQLRNIRVTKDYIKYPDGSCLIEFGDTKVICTAVVEKEVPPFLKGTNTGWVTAEYAMLPASCNQRVKRAISGRTQEIQRLVGRSLRSVVAMDKLGELTIKIDCDVIQADGGTRTASITGGFVALMLACRKLRAQGVIKEDPIKDYVAAVSAGIYKGHLILDLNYEEDSNAQMDMNVVMVGQGNLVEVQGTAEDGTFSREQMNDLLDLAGDGIRQLVEVQKKALGDI
ncbi:MAG: ribonuclease PH [Candidatus Omnitrophica bacterium]|nr:ribonuclease PH [Candidatus Omnitrophota bacterium]